MPSLHFFFCKPEHYPFHLLFPIVSLQFFVVLIIVDFTTFCQCLLCIFFFANLGIIHFTSFFQLFLCSFLLYWSLLISPPFVNAFFAFFLCKPEHYPFHLLFPIVSLQFFVVLVIVDFTSFCQCLLCIFSLQT